MYQLLKSSKTSSGWVRHEVKTAAGDEVIRFHEIRFAFVFPSSKSPAYFVGAGSEIFDEKLEALNSPIIRVTVEHESTDLGLDSFFDTLTDHMSSQIASVVYFDLTKEDNRQTFYSYLDKRGLRNISAVQAPYSDFVLRLGKLKDCDSGGNLLIEKGTPLFGDLRGISRLDLQDDPEIRFYRLSALSMLCAGFLKYPPTKPLILKNTVDLRGGRGRGWML